MNLLKKLVLLVLLTGSVISFSEGNKSVENPTKYSQRDDNYIDKNSLYHEETPEYRIDEGKNVRIILETKNNDVYSAEIIYGGKTKMMRSIGNYGGKEIFVGEIPDTATDYYFKLTDNKTKYF